MHPPPPPRVIEPPVPTLGVPGSGRLIRVARSLLEVRHKLA